MTRKSEAKTPSEELPSSEEAEILEKLAERVETAIRTIRDLRKERDELVRKLKEAEERLANVEHESEQVSDLLDEKESWLSDRREIRDRIENILGRLEQLDDDSVG